MILLELSLTHILQKLDSLIHHLRSSWEVLRADQPLNVLYGLLRGDALPDGEASVSYTHLVCRGTSGGLDYYKDPARSSAANQTYPYGQVGALSPESRFLIEPPWSTHGGEVCNPPENSGLPLND